MRSPNEDEEDAFEELTRFLNEQGELDDTDKRTLSRFLDSNSLPLQLDWTPISIDLDRQGENELLSQLHSQLMDTETAITQIANILQEKFDSEAKLVFLIGAGGSNPSPTEIPTVADLLSILWKKAAEINAPSLLRLKDVCDELNIKDIEVLLTAIEIAQTAVQSRGVMGLLEALLFQRSGSQKARFGRLRQSAKFAQTNPETMEVLSESSQTLLSVLVGMMTGKPTNEIHKALSARITQGNNDTIITTNYDVCIEKALSDQTYRYGLAGEVESSSGPLVLKLHGSLNWYSCRSCDEHVAATLDEIDGAIQSGLYPIVSMCRVCSATAQQMIVPPTAMKAVQHPVLLDIRQKAEHEISDGNVIVVIGYSFTENDQYIQRMIARAVRSDPEKAIVVFDVSSKPCERLEKHLSTHASEFDEKNIHVVVGDAATNVPVFLRGLAQKC